MAAASSPGPTVRKFGFEVRTAWRRRDPGIEADAIDLWTRNGLLPPDVDPKQRAGELIAAAYKDGRLAAVSTAAIEYVDALRARMAVIRGATDAAFRRSHAQLSLAVPSREALEAWAVANPEERLAGAIAYVTPGEWGDFTRIPVWPESELALAGYAEDGSQVRVRWFQYFRYDQHVSPTPLPSAPPVIAADVEFRPAWRLDDSRIEADAIAFWKRLGLLPKDVTPEARAKQLVFVAYRSGRIVGVVTADIGILPQVRARVAMLRGAVDPELRRSHVGLAMLLSAPALLETWSRENPHERLAGFGGILESRELAAAQSQPYWPMSGLSLIGFTPDGRQIRMSWFKDFRLDGAS